MAKEDEVVMVHKEELLDVLNIALGDIQIHLANIELMYGLNSRMYEITEKVYKNLKKYEDKIKDS